MNATSTTHSELREGVNDPSPIGRVIVLDYHDGPMAGVLELVDGSVFRFAMLDERQVETDDAADVRVYGLYPLPTDAFARLTELASQQVPPRWPVWCPRWQFPSDGARADVEKKTGEILGRAGPLSWVIVGDLGGVPIRAVPVQVARAS